jgi:cadmium resistance protein CadD (predicted permease)
MRKYVDLIGFFPLIMGLFKAVVQEDGFMDGVAAQAARTLRMSQQRIPTVVSARNASQGGDIEPQRALWCMDPA